METRRYIYGAVDQLVRFIFCSVFFFFFYSKRQNFHGKPNKYGFILKSVATVSKLKCPIVVFFGGWL